MATCKQCGKDLMPDSSFCTHCGAPVLQEPIPTPDNISLVDETPILSTEAPADIIPAAAPAEESPAPAEYYTPPVQETPWATAPPVPPVYAPPMAPPVPLAEMRPPMAPAYAPPYAPPVYERQPQRNRQINFVNSFLTIVLLGSLLSAAFSLGIIGNPALITLRSLESIAKIFSLYAMIAMAVTLSMRAKGLDLSIPSLMTLSAILLVLYDMYYHSPAITIFATLGTCAVIGLINGVLINYVNIPSLIVTLLAGIAVRGASSWLTNGQALVMERGFLTTLTQNGLNKLALVALALIIAFLMILVSKLGTPLLKREKKNPISYMFAYMGSAVIAGLAGIQLLSNYQVATSLTPTAYDIFIFFAFGCIVSSRAFDNRIAPALYALAPALVFTIVQTVIAIYGLPLQQTTYIQCGLALAFILLGYLVRPELRGKIPALKP